MSLERGLEVDLGSCGSGELRMGFLPGFVFR